MYRVDGWKAEKSRKPRTVLVLPPASQPHQLHIRSIEPVRRVSNASATPQLTIQISREEAVVFTGPCSWTRVKPLHVVIVGQDDMTRACKAATEKGTAHVLAAISAKDTL